MTLDCGRSAFDPDAEPGPFSFEWGCEGPHPDGCFQADEAPLAFADNSPTQVRGHTRISKHSQERARALLSVEAPLPAAPRVAGQR